MFWWWWWIVFEVCLTSARRLALLAAGILAIANAQHAASKIGTCAEPDFSSHSLYSRAPQNFGLFIKIKKGYVTSFWCAFSARFLHEIISYLILLSIEKVSMSYLFSLSRYQTKGGIKFLFRQLMVWLTLRFFFDHPLKQQLTGEKRG